MDLKDFFTSIQASRVEAMFAKLGYSPTVAGTLARLCASTARRPAPSPALANLCAYRLDIRLASLAQALGATYSRYADDLVFSGGRELERATDRLHLQVASIALEEGFRINTRKTRTMRAGLRQQVTGIVINRHPNITRSDYDTLKAILTNCVRHGPQSQNREGRGHYREFLGGKVAYATMLNPARGGKLHRIFSAIAWPQD